MPNPDAQLSHFLSEKIRDFVINVEDMKPAEVECIHCYFVVVSKCQSWNPNGTKTFFVTKSISGDTKYLFSIDEHAEDYFVEQVSLGMVFRRMKDGTYSLIIGQSEYEFKERKPE